MRIGRRSRAMRADEAGERRRHGGASNNKQQ